VTSQPIREIHILTISFGILTRRYRNHLASLILKSRHPTIVQCAHRSLEIFVSCPRLYWVSIMMEGTRHGSPPQYTDTTPYLPLLSIHSSGFVMSPQSRHGSKSMPLANNDYLASSNEVQPMRSLEYGGALKHTLLDAQKLTSG
jgi:hypothetical protein